MKNKYVKTLILVAAFLVLAVTTIASYAYFSASVGGNNSSNDNVIVSGNMELLLTDGDKVSLSNAFPGSSVTKTFKVKNIGNVETTYDVYFSEVVNDFADKNDLVYTITSSNGCASGVETIVPDDVGEQSKMVSSCLINPNQEHEYTLVITFKETNDNQDDNKGKKFSAKISVNEYNDGNSIANAPELYDALVPIKFDNGLIYKADTTEEWYNYDNHEWANAAILTSSGASKTTEALNPDTDIYQMYVWIPRYKYKLFNVGDGTSVDEQMIDVVFEKTSATKSNGVQNGQWLTHPSFTFGNTELSGFWVGKFEPSYVGTGSGQAYGTGYSSSNITGCSTENCSTYSNNVRILPNTNSLRNHEVSRFFYISRSIANTGNTFGFDASKTDSHMMKNMEWGAVAYLTNSKYGLYASSDTCVNEAHNYVNETRSGCQVWHNPSSSIITGCSGTQMNDSYVSCQVWNDATYGGRSSTTGNLYGVYDLSGDSFEIVMGNVSDSSGNFKPGKANGFSTTPDAKYYDSYAYDGSSYTTHNRGKLGDATKETLVIYGDPYGGWYDDMSNFPYSSSPWFARGGNFHEGPKSGIFDMGCVDGDAAKYGTFRVVLSALDNN